MGGGKVENVHQEGRIYRYYKMDGRGGGIKSRERRGLRRREDSC